MWTDARFDRGVGPIVRKREKKREKKRKEDLHALYVLELAEPWHEAAEGFKGLTAFCGEDAEPLS